MGIDWECLFFFWKLGMCAWNFVFWNFAFFLFGSFARMSNATKWDLTLVIFGYDHINCNPPVLIRTPKLTQFEPAQYWGGGPPGNSAVLYPIFLFFFFLAEGRPEGYWLGVSFFFLEVRDVLGILFWKLFFYLVHLPECQTLQNEIWRW